MLCPDHTISAIFFDPNVHTSFAVLLANLDVFLYALMTQNTRRSLTPFLSIKLISLPCKNLVLMFHALDHMASGNNVSDGIVGLTATVPKLSLPLIPLPHPRTSGNGAALLSWPQVLPLDMQLVLVTILPN